MDYGFWLPLVVILILLGGFYLGKKLEDLIKFKNKYLKVLYWILLYGFLFIIIFMKTIFSVYVVYCLALYGTEDIIYLIIKKKKHKELKKTLEKIYMNGIPVLIISLIIIIYGLYNVNNSIVKSYDIVVNKELKEETNILYLSDLHLGTLQNKNILEDIVEKANDIEPDVFVFGGDIFDENTTEEEKKEAYLAFSKIKTKYGIYYTEGNHDILTTKVKNNFINNGITVLDDKSILINNNYYLVGRCDYRRIKLKKGRKNLKELYKNVDKKYPIVVLDHQPITKEIKQLGADLQLSGHTHGGQIFPGNFFIKTGYYKKNNYQMIVSSGYGVWTFAVRTAGRSELVEVNLKN